MLSLLCHDKHHKLTTRRRTPRLGATASATVTVPHRNAGGRICDRIKMHEVYVHRHHKESERNPHTYITVLYGRLLEVTVTRALPNRQGNNKCQHLNARFTVESAKNMGDNRSFEPPDWAVWWGSGSGTT